MAKTREEILATARAWKARNKERCQEYRKNYYATNKQHEAHMRLKWQIANEERFKKTKSDSDRRYREQNPEKIRNRRMQNRERTNGHNRVRYHIDAKIRAELLVRAKFFQAFRRVYLQRGGSSKVGEKLVGCTMDELKAHLESKFLPGMSWDSDFHIDHIVPCSTFDLRDETQQRECFHYSNLQPLWPLENIKKGSRLNIS